MDTSPLSEVIASADREVLIEIVKLAQKLGLHGAKGGWKDYLKCHDKKFGAGLSDPAKRSTDFLVAFLKTFALNKDCEVINRMIRRRSDCAAMEHFLKHFPDKESPQQRLVRLTMEHSLYIQNYSLPSHDEGWMTVALGKISKAMKSKALIAVDCEMVLCEDGTEALVRVCAVDQNLEVKLDKIVNPNKAVADYRTNITAIAAKDLEGVACSLDDIQKSLKKLLSHGTILIGHSLHNDLKALKIDHPRVIDTSYIFTFKNLPTGSVPSLNNLCKSVLGSEIRKEGEPHDCLSDAQSAMKLVLAKLEYGFDDSITVAVKNVTTSDLAKLFLHKIPVKVPCEKLQRVFPVEYNIDIQTDLRVRGQYYSTYAVFRDAKEADAAYRRTDGQEKQDSCGRLQKNVRMDLSTKGESVTFCIRKMRVDGLLDDGEQPKPKKRLATEDDLSDSRRQRSCSHQCDHAEENERLKQLLRKKDGEIFNLQKILCAMTRKHGL